MAFTGEADAELKYYRGDRPIDSAVCGVVYQPATYQRMRFRPS